MGHFAKKPIGEIIRRRRTRRKVADVENFGENGNKDVLDSDWEEGEGVEQSKAERSRTENGKE